MDHKANVNKHRNSELNLFSCYGFKGARRPQLPEKQPFAPPPAAADSPAQRARTAAAARYLAPADPPPTSRHLPQERPKEGGAEAKGLRQRRHDSGHRPKPSAGGGEDASDLVSKASSQREAAHALLSAPGRGGPFWCGRGHSCRGVRVRTVLRRSRSGPAGKRRALVQGRRRLFRGMPDRALPAWGPEPARRGTRFASGPGGALQWGRAGAPSLSAGRGTLSVGCSRAAAVRAFLLGRGSAGAAASGTPGRGSAPPRPELRELRVPGRERVPGASS